MSFSAILPVVSLINLFIFSAGQGTFVPYSHPYIQYTGRTTCHMPNNPFNGCAFDWQNSGFVFTITNASFVLAALNQKFNNSTSESIPPMNRLNVYTNLSNTIVHTATLITSPTQTLYTLAAGLFPKNTYTIQVTKISEAAWNEGTPEFPEWLLFTGIQTDGVLVLPQRQAPLRRLEFIGDSLTAGKLTKRLTSVPFIDVQPSPLLSTWQTHQSHTIAGYGVDHVGPCAAQRYNSAWDVSWASLVCANFSADCNTEAWSGKGLYINNGNGYFAPRMPELTTYTCGSDAECGNWTYTVYIPDAIVINLGTNDYSTPYAKLPGFDANFTAAYVAFLKDIYSTRYHVPGKLPIFCTVGPVTSSYYNSTVAAVQEANAAGIDAYLIDLSGALDCPTCVGCAGHPGVDGMQRMATMAWEVISSVLSW